MRAGELFGLKWTHVDFAARLITVEGTKSGYLRKIPMNSELTAILSGVKKESASEYVFADRTGKPFKGVRTALDNALQKAKIEGITLHSLRHTFGTRLGMAGWDVRTIQELMGHRDIKMTMRYSHPTPEHKRKALESLCGVPSNFRTGQIDTTKSNVVSIGNR